MYLLDSLNRAEEDNLLSYLWLSAELRGQVESPHYYFEQKGPETSQALDHLLLTQGWRRFRWKEVSQQPASLNFLPEYEGHLIQVQVKDTDAGKPLAGISAYLSVPGKLVQFYTAKSNEKGEGYFVTNQLFGNQDLVLQAFPNKKTPVNLSLVNPFSQQFSQRSAARLVLHEKEAAHIQARHLYMQTQNAYWQDERSQIAIPVLDSTAFYGPPDITYKLDDFTRFNTMEEVMREYVYEIRVRKQNNKYTFKIFNPAENDFFSRPPLVLLDGVPVLDIDHIIGYDPLQVEKLDIVKERFVSGEDVVHDGIVSYTTYTGLMEGFPLGNMQKMVYHGLQYEREFFSPTYETTTEQSARRTDFRNLLYWSSNISTSTTQPSKVSFYTSDLKGEYLVVIQGIARNGNAGMQIISFEVTDGNP